jgi:hypothetical protein
MRNDRIPYSHHGAPLHLRKAAVADECDAKLLENPLAKIDDPPTHDAMDRRCWTVLDHFYQRRAVLADPGGLEASPARPGMSLCLCAQNMGAVCSCPYAAQKSQ